MWTLHLHRSGLAPPTPCRSPGALRVLSPQPGSRVSVGGNLSVIQSARAYNVTASLVWLDPAGPPNFARCRIVGGCERSRARRRARTDPSRARRTASNPTPHGGCDGAEKNAKGRRREDIKARSRRETAIRRGSCGHGETRPLRGSLRHRSSGNGAGTARSFLVADMQQIYHR